MNPPKIPPGLEPESSQPAKQARSRQLRDKVIAQARELVQQGRYDATAMADIARAADCSVGSLYQRFRDKKALFASVAEVTMAAELDAVRAQAAAGRYRGLGLRDTVHRCVQDYERFVQRNASLVRMLYQHGIEEPGSWSIARVPTFHMVQVWIDAVAQAAGRGGERDFVRQVGIAFQFVGGALVHAVLVDALVRPLSSRQMVFWLDEMALHFIGLDVPEPLRSAPVVKPNGVATPAATRARKPSVR